MILVIAAMSLVGTWDCAPLKGGGDHSVAQMTANGKLVSRSPDGAQVPATWHYSGGILTETLMGTAIKLKVVWHGPNAFDLITSEPDMESKHCTRAH